MTFDHYLLRQVSGDDAAAYFRLIERNRKRLDFFAGTLSKNKTPEDTQVFMEDIVKRTEAGTYMAFVVEDTSTRELIGFIDVKNIDHNIPKAELGCFIDEHYAGKGVSAKALSMVTGHLFDRLGFNKLFLRTHQGNRASRALAEKCGFEVEGIIRKDYKTAQGEIVDLIYYGKLRDA